MGGCFSFNRPSIEIIDEMPKGKQFDYLRSKGKITYTVNRMYDVPEIEINFNGWYRASVRLWQKSTKMSSNFLDLQRTPLPSPNFLLLHLTIVVLIQYFGCLILAFFFYTVLMNTVQNNFKNSLRENINWEV